MTSLMTRKALSRYALPLMCALTFACAQFQGAEGEKADTPSGSAGETKHLIIGSWKLTAINCEGLGKNCRRYTGKRVFRFAGDGDFFIDGTKRGTYRLENSECVLDRGDRRYAVTILELDSTRMITGESFRKTTEIFQKTE